MYALRRFTDEWRKGASKLVYCPKCENPLIPGLDASMCATCLITYRDPEETQKFYDRKKSGIF